MDGLSYVALKSQKDKGGRGGRINAWSVLGIFGMCMSSDISHLRVFFERVSGKRETGQRERERSGERVRAPRWSMGGQKRGDGAVKLK